MKKINNLSQESFLKLFFAFVSVCFLVAAVIMPDRSEMFSGLWKILSGTCKISTNYFALGGYAATYLNMGLVGLICTGLCFLPKIIGISPVFRITLFCTSMIRIQRL